MFWYSEAKSKYKRVFSSSAWFSNTQCEYWGKPSSTYKPPDQNVPSDTCSQGRRSSFSPPIASSLIFLPSPEGQTQPQGDLGHGVRGASLQLWDCFSPSTHPPSPAPAGSGADPLMWAGGKQRVVSQCRRWPWGQGPRERAAWGQDGHDLTLQDYWPHRLCAWIWGYGVTILGYVKRVP